MTRSVVQQYQLLIGGVAVVRDEFGQQNMFYHKGFFKTQVDKVEILVKWGARSGVITVTAIAKQGEGVKGKLRG